jgi:sugar phosphate isomerase/epimerase
MFRVGAITDELSADTLRALDLAQQHGLQDVEIHTAWGTNIEQLSSQQIEQLRDLLDNRGLRACCVSSTVFLRCHLDGSGDEIPPVRGFNSITGSYPEHLTALERCFEAAAALNAPLIRVFGFWGPGASADEAAYHAAADKLAQAARMAQAAAVTLALENCPHTAFCWGQRAARLVALVNSPALRMLWDPGNAFRCGEQDYLAAYDAIRPHLAHVHAKDLLVGPEIKGGRAYVQIGTGQLDWRSLLLRLARDGYSGVVSLEPHYVAADGTHEGAAADSIEGLQRIRDEVVSALAAQGNDR